MLHYIQRVCGVGISFDLHAQYKNCVARFTGEFLSQEVPSRVGEHLVCIVNDLASQILDMITDFSNISIRNRE